MESGEINQIEEQLFIYYATQKYLDSLKKDKAEIIRVRTEAHVQSFDKFIDKGVDKDERLIFKPLKITANSNPFDQAE